MSESANQDDEAPADAPTPSEQPSPAQPSPKPGLLAELLEGAEPASPRGTGQALSSRALSARVGWLVEWASGSAPTVDFPGNELGPLAARSVIPLDPSLVTEAIAAQRGVLLSFEDGGPDMPIIMGLLQPLVFEVELEELEDREELEEHADSDTLPGMHASVDGKRVEIEAADEIVLRCGQASIVLRRNGRVVIRGTYVETRSRGVNRIKGGSVQIN